MPISAVKIKNENGIEVYSLKEPSVINFGRDKKVCHITFDPQAARVSRVHASVEWNAEGITFVDKSKEGTLINGKRVKQSKESLDEGVYQLEIGGFSMSIEVEGDDLEETVVESLSPVTNKPQEAVIHESPFAALLSNKQKKPSVTEVSDDEFDKVTTISMIRPMKKKSHLKRKSDACLFDESQPRGKRGPLTDTPLNFDEEMDKVVTKGPRSRKADTSVVFEDETPAKKIKANSGTKSAFLTKSPSIENGDEMEIIVNQVAAIPSVSQESEEQQLDHSELHFDRGPAAPNEKIKYTNLIFHPPQLQKKETSFFDTSVPNFKRFVPKNMRGDGRTSVASMRSNTSCNTTIPMIDSRVIR